MARNALLFSYGTLQHKDVQVANFGRELGGRADALPGFVRRQGRHANAEKSSNPADEIAGMAFEVTEKELAAADRYEATAGYHRISVTLRSGAQAWVYVEA